MTESMTSVEVRTVQNEERRRRGKKGFPWLPVTMAGCVEIYIFFFCIKIWTAYMDIMSDVIVTWQCDEAKLTLVK